MSHCDRILRALRDGRWHTSMALYLEVGHCVLHSRISDLRHKGFNVEGRHVPGKSGAEGYEYRLRADFDVISPAGPTENTFDVLNEAMSSVAFVGATKVRQPAIASSPDASAAEQLSLHVAPAHYDI